MPITRARTPAESKYRDDPVWAIALGYDRTAGGKARKGFDATSPPLLEDIHGPDSPPIKRMRSLAGKLASGTELNIHVNPWDPHMSYAISIDDPGKAPLYRTGAICAAMGRSEVGLGKTIEAAIIIRQYLLDHPGRSSASLALQKQPQKRTHSTATERTEGNCALRTGHPGSGDAESDSVFGKWVPGGAGCPCRPRNLQAGSCPCGYEVHRAVANTS